MIFLKILLVILDVFLALGGIIFWAGFIWAMTHKQKLRMTREMYTLEEEK